MLRSIYEKLSAALGANRRRKAPRRARPRKLAVESLESRKLLTAAILTFDSISDGSFAAPALPANASQPAPASTPWTFLGNSGVGSNDSAFTVGSPKAPSGSQVAYIKDGASISQTVYLNAGVYNVSFLAAQRVEFQTCNQSIEILVDGTSYGTVDPPVDANAPGQPVNHAYLSYESLNFTELTDGTHTIRFQGMSLANQDSTAFISEVSVEPVDDSLLNGGFEQPMLAANSYQADPSGLAWQFQGTAGVSKNGSDLQTNWVEAQNAPAGTQVGYIQNGGGMIQTAYLDAGTYDVSFLAAQRAISQSSYEEIEIVVDGHVLLDGGQPDIIDPVNNLYGSYESSPFTVAAGPHTIEFLGISPGGNNCVFIDQASLSAANALDDGTFETTILPPQSYQPDPSGFGWNFSGSAGVSTNGSGFTAGNANAPQFTQVAYIKDGGYMTQSVFVNAGSYNVSFLAAQRVRHQTNNQQIEVVIDHGQAGQQVLPWIMPTNNSNNDYTLYQTLNFNLTAGAHTIEFLGGSPASDDSTVFLDEVALVATNDQIADGSFAAPVLTVPSGAAGAYRSGGNFSGSAWQFSGSAGISTNHSPFTAGSAQVPQGDQVAFIKDGGSMSQSVYLDTGTYYLSLVADQRAVYQITNETIEVVIDPGQADQQVLPSITPSSNSYALYQTLSFSVTTAKTFVIEFLGTITSPGDDSTAFIERVSIATANDQISDGNFQTPVLTVPSGQTGTYEPAPSGCGWTFSGNSGVTTNNSDFTSGTANAPAGNQAGYIKDGAYISQSVYFDAGTYSVSFLATQRYKYQTQNQSIEVLLDPGKADQQVIALVTPPTSVTTITNASVNDNDTYTPYETSNFTVPAGAHTIEFLGMSPSTADSTAFICGVSISTGCSIANGDFEDPALAAKTYQIGPSGSGWNFSGIAGISTNQSGFTGTNPNAPDGLQVAFLKDTGSMSQSVYLAAGIYNISFLAAQRHVYQSQAQTIQVTVDGIGVVGTATPSAPSSDGNRYPTGTNYGLYETTTFKVTTAGTYTIVFAGLSPTTADSTAFIDDVQLNV